MWVNTGKKLINLDKFAQVAIEVTEDDVYQIVASNDDIEEEVAVLGEFTEQGRAERILGAITREMDHVHCVYSLYDNWLPELDGYDCPGL